MTSACGGVPGGGGGTSRNAGVACTGVTQLAGLLMSAAPKLQLDGEGATFPGGGAGGPVPKLTPAGTPKYDCSNKAACACPLR